MAQFLKVEMDGKVAVVTLNNPPVNILTSALMKELEQEIVRLGVDPAVRAVVITGSGPIFVAGADIKEIAAIQDAGTGTRMASEGQRIFGKVAALGKPVIAAINGVCLGGGMELALACHLRVASDRAKMAQPEINLGIIPGFGGTQRLARLAGRAKAAEWILTGDNLTPQDAKAAGVVNLVVPESEVLRQAVGLAKKIAAKPAVAVRRALLALSEGLDAPTLEAGLAVEAKHFGECCTSADKAEGVKAFLEKRQPKFTEQ
jgi:enoyl-CoA hydratase/carnithine racemase